MTDQRKDEMPLKRCPFCGGEGTGGNTALGTLYWCVKCGVERRTKEQWNNRADLSPPVPDDVAEAIEHLRDGMKRAKEQNWEASVLRHKDVETLIRALASLDAVFSEGE